MLQSYIAYGLIIRSPFPLLTTTSDSSEADITVSPGKVDYPDSIDEATSTGVLHYFDREDIYFHSRFGNFLIREGKEIIVDLLTDADLSHLHLFILGVCMAGIMHQRGFLVLHGTAVSIDGQGAAFVANSGWGKSTMAATLQNRGHKFITDDVLCIDLKASEAPLVIPAVAQQSLWSDAISSLGECSENFPKLSNSLDKRFRQITSGFSSVSVPLKQIYILGTSSEIEVRILEAQEAFMNIIANSFSAWVSNDQKHQKASHKDFLQTMELCKKAEVYLLKRPRSLELLPEIATLVEKKMAENKLE